MTNNPNGRGGWQKGQSGNPSGLPGRPLGTKHKIAGAFLADTYAEWQRSGKSALKRMAENDPSKFVQVVAGLLPKETAIDITLAVQNRFAEMSYAELLQLKEAYDGAVPAEPALLEAPAEDDANDDY
jgi:hypothetical protein